MNSFKTLALCAALLAATGAAQAVGVSSYDIARAEASGYGGWSHSYTGSIVNNASGTFYAGGSGSLNDGITASGVDGTQLFSMSDNTAITLHLSDLTAVQSISLFGGAPGNAIPGTLTGWSVTVGGTTQAFSSTGFGANCSSGLCNDSVSLIGSGLDLMATNTVTLSGFQGGWSGYFSIAEATVTGNTVAAVPEPETYALMFAGLFAVGYVARRRQAR